MRRVFIALIFVAALTGGAWFFIRMPGPRVLKAAALSLAELTLRDELKTDVQKLAGEIGERNMWHYAQLNATADFIESEFQRAGLQTKRNTYELEGKEFHNIEAEIRGNSPEMVVVGAHYDSVSGCPGANDNGSGVAGMLALTRRFAKRSMSSTLRFVAFVNEEPPFFQTPQMGSLVYAGHCREQNEHITAMISLETIGYFSDEPGSQTYPAIGLAAFYPTVGNFIGFVGNTGSRALLRRALATFRAQKKLPSESAALPQFIPGIGWSDHWAFWQHDYPAIMITDTAPFRYRHYHEPSDTPDKLDYDRFALVVSGMEQVIARLANKL
jgi:Zn-dependent M28 family amino/carboxypeptidase